jgi:beta-glucanase (GH16 family)
MLAANMVFDDEFNLPAGSQPNSSTWFHDTGTSANNSNVDFTDTASTLAVVNDAGATDGKALAMSLYPDPNNAGKYLAARINTTVDPLAANWQYGHIEARIKLPGGPNGQGDGIWPAFWMLGSNFSQVGWPNCGEIDIMENKGSTPGQVQGTIHGPGYSGGNGITAFYNLPSGQNFYSAYHVFAADWGPNFVNFSVDGHVYASRSPANLPGGTTWAFNHPFDIILDIQEGGGFAGPPDANSTYPQTMLVDYVRAAAFPLAAVPPLTDADIGSPGLAGSSNFDGLAWTVNGSGSDIWNTSDQFHFTSQSFTGDVTITARVDNLLNTGTYAKTGIMIRGGTAANASYAFVFVNPPNGQTGDGVNFEFRGAAGANSQAAGSTSGITAPEWLQLRRIGNTFTAFDSSDGVTWTQLGPSETIAMSGTATVGLAVDANSNAALNTAMFRSVSIVPGGWSDGDIGSPGAAGFASFDPTSASWTVSGSGADIWTSADQFNFVQQNLSGDGSVIAHVTALANTNAWAKAGVMLRNDETAGSTFANVDLTPGNGVTFQWRATAGTAAASTTVSGISAPIWVKLTRFEGAFSGYYSTDGVHWTQIGTSQSITMNTGALAGLAVTAHDNAAASAATFSNVAVLSAQVTNNLDSGPGSLRQALLDAAAIPGVTHTIRFTLPAGSQTINLLSPLPAVTDPLILLLDFTQMVTIALPSGTVWNDNTSLTLSGVGSLAISGGIEGTGTLTVNAGSNLTAGHIVQGALVIGGTAGSAATVTIAASDAAGNPLSAEGGSGLGAGGSERGPLESSDGVAGAASASSMVVASTASNPAPSAVVPYLTDALFGESAAIATLRSASLAANLEPTPSLLRSDYVAAMSRTTDIVATDGNSGVRRILASGPVDATLEETDFATGIDNSLVELLVGSTHRHR